MNYSIEISEQAAADLRKLYKYIADKLLSPENAAGQLSRIEKGIMSLNSMPHRFSAYEKEPWHSIGLRKMPIDNFIVFYIPDDEKMLVTVIRIMYGGRNIDRELAERKS